MPPDFGTPFLRGVLEGVAGLLPALLIVLGIMVAFSVLIRRRALRQRRSKHRL